VTDDVTSSPGGASVTDGETSSHCGAHGGGAQNGAIEKMTKCYATDRFCSVFIIFNSFSIIKYTNKTFLVFISASDRIL
jgi:hypothetical protein